MSKYERNFFMKWLIDLDILLSDCGMAPTSFLTWRTSSRLAAERRLCTLCLLMVISPTGTRIRGVFH